MDAEQQQTVDEFHEVVNMAPSELEEWLGTEASRSVGVSEDGGESKGHASGRWIVELLRKNKDEYTETDLDHMSTVVGYARRHLAQRPDGDIEDTRWRYSLMNWGHDPMKD